MCSVGSLSGFYWWERYTRRTMRTLMINTLAVRLNFKGRGDKVSVSDMKKIIKVIIGKACYISIIVMFQDNPGWPVP